MSDYKVTDTELISVANAIRTKGGTQAQLEWPSGFVSAIGSISGGSGVGGVNKTLLYECNASQGGSWINTNVDVSDINQLLIEDIRSDDLKKSLLFDIDEIAVYTGGTDVYTSIYEVDGANFNIRIYNNYLYVSYSVARSSSYVTKIYEYAEISGGGSGGGVAPEADDWSALDTYIQSSGTQYIDTGYDITSDTKIECVCNISNANTYPAPFGTRVGYHNNELYVMYRSNNTNTTSFAWANNNSDATVGLDFGGNVNEKVEITASKEGLRILTENIYKSITFLVRSPSAPINDNPLFIFGMNDGGVIDSNTKCTMKLYCFRIYESDTLVHEFIPWVDDNDVVCLKDTVTGNLKYNAGTGTFTYGTDS